MWYKIEEKLPNFNKQVLVKYIKGKQGEAYASLERDLVEQGLKLCATKEDKKQFFDKYAVAYNNKLKQNGIK